MELYRLDYTLLGMVSSNCMKVLPISQNDEAEKKTQKCRSLLAIKKELFKCFKSAKEKLTCYSKHYL